MSKGSKRRPENHQKFQKGYDKAFGGNQKSIRNLKNYNQRRNNNGR